MRGYKTIRSMYHRLVPEHVRDHTYRIAPKWLKRLKKRTVSAFERDAKHDEIYDSAYYQKFVEPTMRMSAGKIAESIMKELAPRSVLDIGCGTGVLEPV